MNVRDAASRYKGVQVNTCSPAKLVQMLLDGALRFASEAQVAMRAGDRARSGERTARCQAIVEELASTLDPEKSPELCDNLLGIYMFCMRRLTEANAQQDPRILDEVRTSLEPLRDAWAAIAASP